MLRYDVLLRDLIRFVPKLDFEAMTKVACSLRQLDHKCPLRLLGNAIGSVSLAWFQLGGQHCNTPGVTSILSHSLRRRSTTIHFLPLIDYIKVFAMETSDDLSDYDDFEQYRTIVVKPHVATDDSQLSLKVNDIAFRPCKWRDR